MVNSEEIIQWIDFNQLRFTEISDKIWEFAEIRFEEVKSAKLQIKVLEEEGFEISKGLANMPTAFIGSYGEEGPIIAILGEYDALAGLSQKANKLEISPVKEGGHGHGCGHNLLGAGSLAAAIAVKHYLNANKIPGIVRYYGCPGEEGGSGKTYMVREGLFDDVDIALCWHPFSTNFLFNISSLANIQAYFRFTGRSAHAAGAPHQGRSALDAVELMNVGANYLREHIITEARVHYAVTNTGGNAPNVVQAKAEVLYLIRAPEMSQAQEIYDRVIDIARGAALMTGTEVEVVFDKAASNIIPNNVVGKVLHERMLEVGVPQYSKDELDFGKKLQKTFGDSEPSEVSRYKIFEKQLGTDIIEKLRTRIMFDAIFPNTLPEFTLPGSTDVGDVSWVVPTAQIGTACMVIGTPGHSWQETTQSAMSVGHKGMIYAAKVLALATLDFMEKPELIEEAKKELGTRLNAKHYSCPILSEIKPNVPEWVFDAMK